MAGTKIGGRKAAATNKREYGEDFYNRIGKVGGKKGRTGGFYGNSAAARIAGAKGGRISSRTGIGNGATRIKVTVSTSPTSSVAISKQTVSTSPVTEVVPSSRVPLLKRFLRRP